MQTSTKAHFENILFDANNQVQEIHSQVGRNLHRTILIVNGVRTALRIITNNGTKFYTK